MIVGLGIDLVATGRIAKLRTRHGELFLAKVYTEGETTECLSRKLPDEGLAARFAAKEAALKALGTGLADGVSWREVEIVSGGGKPELRLHGRAREVAEKLGAARWLVSLTHDGEYAGAVVILEG